MKRSLGEAGDAEPIAFDTFNQTTSNVNQTIKSPQGGVNESIGVVAQPIAIAENTIGRQPMNGGNGDGFTEDGPMYTLNATGVHGVAQPFRKVRRAQSDSDFETWEKDETANTLNCFDVGDVRSTNVVAQPIAYSFDALSSNSMKSSNPHSGCRQVDVAKTLDTTTPEPSKNQGGIAIAQSIAVDTFNQTINERTSQTIGSSASDVNHYGAVMQPIVAPTLTASNDPSRSPQSSEVTNQVNAVFLSSMAIRRLTPKECERLQGFPDDWTKIPYRNKPADQCPDGPRYKACGNSMAVPVMRWIGERIQLIDTIIN